MMRHPGRWLLLLGAVGALIVILAYQRGFNDGELMPLVVWTVWLTVVGAAIIRTFRGRLSDALQAALVWVVVALVLVAAYTYRFELSNIGNRIFEKLVPGRGAGAAMSNTVKVKRL
jgi:predicted aspartyl protease